MSALPPSLRGRSCEEMRPKALRGGAAVENLFCGASVRVQRHTCSTRDTNHGPLTARSPGRGEFCAIARGWGRRVSRSQVKVQTRRITGPAPRPEMQEAARRRHAQNILQPRTQKQSLQLGRGCHTIARQRRRPAKNSSAACNRLPSSGARCLPANYGERALKCQGKVTIVTEIAKNRKRKHRKDIVYIHKKLFA